MIPIRPQPALLTIWRIYLALLAAVPAFLASLLFDFAHPWWIGITGGWVLFFLAGHLYLLPLRLRKLTFRLAGDSVVVSHGVFTTRVDTLPLRNIQFTVRRTGPLSTLFGLSTLVVAAAGGRVRLPGLPTKDAQALAATLPLEWKQRD